MKRRIPAFLLAALMLISMTACGGTASGDDTSAPPQTSGTDTTPAEPEYVFPTDYEGQTFTILNIEDIFSMHAKIAPDETNGESLNDAQFNAVQAFEEATGVDLVETNVHLQDTFQDYFQQFILAAEDIFDIAYMNQRDYWTFASQNYMQNLLEIDGFQFENDYWNIAYNNALIINGSRYMAQGYAHLTLIDSIGALMFNRSMMDALNLELPYQAVKDGKWTMDLFMSYLKSGANLNGDESFVWKDGGECTWGLVLPNNTGNFLTQLGETAVKLENNELVLTLGSERFYNVCEKIASLFNQDDGCVVLAHYSGDDLPDSYVGIFENERAMFGQTEVAKTGRLRAKEFNFGLVPYPKYDENQDRYYSTQAYPVSGVSIPTTVVNTKKSAELADALNYIFKRDVWETFTETTLEQKNLRDDESIEMLDILVESAVPNYSSIFSLDTTGFYTSLASTLRNGDSETASLVAATKSAMEAALNAINNHNS